jgi:hypothetical protein
MEDTQMNTRFATITAVFLLLAVGATSPSWAQTEEEHEVHHPEASEVLPDAAETGMPDPSPGGTQGMMPGMMGGGMQGMEAMPGMMGMSGMGQYGMMPGDMMAMCPMMPGMMQGRGMMGRGAMPGAFGGHGNWFYGLPGAGQSAETTPETARAWLERQLEHHDNPRLRIGSVERQEDGTVIAEIETVDGSLVQRLVFNRYPGFVRRAED